MRNNDAVLGLPVSKKKINVLVVDDESAIREMIRFSLGRADMNVRGAADAREALAMISKARPDIILMDWMMPGISGIELTRRLRRDELTADVPIIMLTARISEDDKVAGLEAGTDDYIIKPFSPRELVARINAVLRRSSPADEQGRMAARDLVLDTRSRTVTGAGAEIKLGPTEYRLLEFFMRTRAGHTAAARFWIMSGVPMYISKNEPSMYISGDCEKHCTGPVTVHSFRP